MGSGLVARVLRAVELSSLNNPTAWLLDMLGGASDTAAGIKVNPKTALGVSAVFACINVIAEDVGSLPLPVYRRLQPRGKERAPEHPLYPLLHDSPNPEMSAMDFRSCLQSHVGGWGNGYAEIEKNGNGRVTALWPLRPDRMTVKRIKGKLWYIYDLPAGVPAMLRPDQVLHIRGLAFDGIRGYSPVTLAREAIALAVATETFGAKFFANNARPGGVIEHPNKLSDKAYDRLKASWNERHEGLDNQHRMAILEEGMKLHEVGLPPEDAQFLQTQQFQVRQIARWFRMQPHKIGDLENATFCLPGDALVFTDTGPRPISGITVGERVWSRDGDKWVLSPVEAAACSGSDEILEIKTGLRTLRANARHKVPVRRKVMRETVREHGRVDVCAVYEVEWVPAGEIRMGDQLLALHGLPDSGVIASPSRAVCTEAFMEALGMLVGDGFFGGSRGYKTTVGISHGERDSYLPHYVAAIEQEFAAGDGPYAMRNGGRVVLEGKVRDRNSTVFYSSPMYAELEQCGIAGTAKTKSVPSWIFGLADNLKLAFLRGYLDADGTVTKTGHIRYVSVNRELLEGVRHLCMSAGVRVGNIFYSDIASEFNGVPYEHRLYGFVCTNGEDNRRIGTYTTMYQERLDAVAVRKRSRTMPIYPCEARKRAQEPGLLFAPVLSIRHEPTVAVYDLSVAGTHNFVADGVLVRNSNIEHQSIEHVVDTIRPWCVRWEQAILQRLLTKAERREFFAEHLVDGLLRGDSVARADARSKEIGSGSMTLNEARELENRNPYDSAIGDIPFINGALVPVTIALLGPQGKDKSPAPAPGVRARRSTDSRLALRKTFGPLFVDVGGRIVRRERSDVIRAAEKFLGRRDAADFDAWLLEFYADHPEYVRAQTTPVFRAFAEAVQREAALEVGALVGMNPELDVFVRDYVDTYAARHVESSLGQLQALAREAADTGTDLLPMLRERLDSWVETRPGKIAMWETVRSGEAFARESYRQAGVTKLVWRTHGENCPACSSMNGKIVGIDESFAQQGDSFDMGSGNWLSLGSNISHPALHGGCDCSVEAHQEG